jgi:hydroxylaminobenzene mutase
MEIERRMLFRQGSLFLLLATMIGIILAAGAPHPAKWLAAHLSVLLTGILLLALGGLWSELRLPAATRRRAMILGLTGSWLGAVANIYAAVVNLPGPASDPGRAPDAMWQLYVFFALLAVDVPATIAAFFLLWRGLRG